MSSVAVVDGVPFWTEKMYRPGGGQDHLGLGSVVTDRILPRLSPSINVLTIHPRYWSFYAFVLSEFWKRDLPRTRSALRAWYRPLECIYSIACHLCTNPGHRGSSVGSRKIAGLVAGGPEGFDPRFDYMESSMGGYGLYYATVMQSHGLVVLADARLGLPVDSVTPSGQLVAEAFRSTIADTAYYRDWIEIHDEPVPYDVALEYGDNACLCRLRETGAPDRALLADVFLHSGNPVDVSSRRETIRFFCELAAQTAPSPVDPWSFRRLVYFRADYQSEDGEGARFTPTAETLRAARRWRLYQSREYFNFSLNEMWRRLTEWGLARDGDTFPVPVADVVESLDGIDFDAFARALEVAPPGLTAASPFAALMDWVADAGGVTGGLDDPWDLNAALTEDLIVDWLGYGAGAAGSGPDVLAAAMALLALVAARLWRPEMALVEPADWFPVVDGGAERLGMQRYLDTLRSRITAGATVGDVTRWLTLDYVVSQHERVAAAKLATTGDTFRFRREAGRMRFFDKESRFRMNDSRFNALATVLYELGWSGYLFEEDHDLTPDGQELREHGDLSATGLISVGEARAP
jgi:hypothetical protein